MDFVIAIFGQAAGDITAVTVNPDGRQTVLDHVASSANNPIFSGDGKWLAYLPDPSDSSSVTQVYHLSGTSAQPVTFHVPPQVSAGADALSEPTAVPGAVAHDCRFPLLRRHKTRNGGGNFTVIGPCLSASTRAQSKDA